LFLVWCPFWLIGLWLHRKVLMDLHEGLARGHFGINTTIKWISATCYWCPTLSKNIILLTQNKVFNYQVMKLSKGTIFYWYQITNITFLKNQYIYQYIAMCKYILKIIQIITTLDEVLNHVLNMSWLKHFNSIWKGPFMWFHKKHLDKVFLFKKT